MVVKVSLMRKDFKRQDGNRQLKVLAKIGYETAKRFREIERHEIKLLDRNKQIYTISDPDYKNLKNTISDEKLRLFATRQKIKHLILQAIDNDEEINAEIIHKQLYQIEYANELEKKQKGWNEFLSQYQIEVSKTEIEELEREIEFLTQEQGFITDEDIGNLATSIQFSKVLSKEQKMIAKMDYNTRYQKGHFDRHNIFDVFGFLWSESPLNGDPYIPKSYRSLILQLNDYRYNALPPHLISDFNKEWIDAFFKYLIVHGYPDIRIKGYNPFNIHKYHEKLKNAKRKPYKVQAFEKVVKHFKRYLALLKEYDMIRYHKEVSLISANNYLSREVVKDQYTKKEFSLNPEEYNKLATTDFKDDKLNLARDMFVIMVQGGGFRTMEIFKYVKLNGNEITVYRPKTKVVATNPIWGHLADVVARHNGLPQNLLPVQEFRAALKDIAIRLDFNRVITRPNTVIHNKKRKDMTIEDEIEHIKIKEVFNPEFARKTLVTYLSHVKQLKDEDIIAFTSHKNTKTLNHYKSSRTIVEKTLLIE